MKIESTQGSSRTILDIYIESAAQRQGGYARNIGNPDISSCLY
jgi:hypothetical protein